jgi:hypothetical protein
MDKRIKEGSIVKIIDKDSDHFGKYGKVESIKQYTSYILIPDANIYSFNNDIGFEFVSNVKDNDFVTIINSKYESIVGKICKVIHVEDNCKICDVDVHGNLYRIPIDDILESSFEFGSKVGFGEGKIGYIISKDPSVEINNDYAYMIKSPNDSKYINMGMEHLKYIKDDHISIKLKEFRSMLMKAKTYSFLLKNENMVLSFDRFVSDIIEGDDFLLTSNTNEWKLLSQSCHASYLRLTIKLKSEIMELVNNAIRNNKFMRIKGVNELYSPELIKQIIKTDNILLYTDMLEIVDKKDMLEILYKKENEIQ